MELSKNPVNQVAINQTFDNKEIDNKRVNFVEAMKKPNKIKKFYNQLDMMQQILFLSLIMIVSIVAFAGPVGKTFSNMNQSNYSNSVAVNNDPRVGRVYVDNGSMFKMCDGSTLVYSKIEAKAGVSTVPNSPECK